MMKTWLRGIEIALLAAGLVLVLWVGANLMRLHYVESLPVPPAAPQATHPESEPSNSPGVVVTIAPQPGAIIAKLIAPAAHLSATVLEGSDDATLAKGAGHIEDTALPGQSGNIAIAGHRDTVFRAVRKMRVGDELDLATAEKTYRYQIAKTIIVKPEDVYVLDPGPKPMLTLVTCYPFEFLGHAPRRYIVQAVLIAQDQIASTAAAPASSKGRP